MSARVVLATVLALALPAAADPKSDASKAFTAGEKADRAGKWAQAIEHYKRAYVISPHPNVAYNIALDLERLGKLREAYDWYAKFVEATTDTATAERAEARMEQLRARPAPISVTSKPAGIPVIIDGAKVGTTPYKSTLAQGNHTIVIKPNEQGRREHNVVVEFGEKVVIDERYDAAPARPAPAPKSSGAVTLTPAMAATDPDVDAPGVTPGLVPPADPTGADTGEPGTGATPRKAIGFVVGGGIGVGLAEGSRDMMYVAELGTRLLQYDFVVRVGASGGSLALDGVIRYAFGDGRVVPFLGAGFAYQLERYGYCAVGGLRFDMTRGDAFGTSLVVESGVRLFSGSSDAMSDGPGALVPVVAYLEVVK